MRFQDRPLPVTNHQLLELHIQFLLHMTITHDQVAGMISQLPGLNDYNSFFNTKSSHGGQMPYLEAHPSLPVAASVTEKLSFKASNAQVKSSFKTTNATEISSQTSR